MSLNKLDILTKKEKILFITNFFPSYRKSIWEKLLSNKKNIVFILWGNHAQSFKHLINQNENLVLCSSHPSPLSAHRGFFGNKHFSKCNQYLADKKIQPIKW